MVSVRSLSRPSGVHTKRNRSRIECRLRGSPAGPGPEPGSWTHSIEIGSVLPIERDPASREGGGILLEMYPRSADRLWAYAHALLRRAVSGQGAGRPEKNSQFLTSFARQLR